MPGYIGVILFFTLFIGVAAFIVIASRREVKRWHARPGILRALAMRRGYRVIENPGKPSDLIPIRPLENAANLKTLELPVAVSGRTPDGDLTLFDVYTEKKSGSGNHVSYIRDYETFITIKSQEQVWPHFELSVVSHSTPASMEGRLLAMAGNLAEMMMTERGLTHVPVSEQPGFQLYAGDQRDANALRDLLLRQFANRTGWWVGGLNGALTLQRIAGSSGTQRNLVPEPELDRFIDESLEIEKSLRVLCRSKE
ncbi:MAG: hypothetical protein ACRD3J_07190 [Thermoanaerobaculia bacterium]